MGSWRSHRPHLRAGQQGPCPSGPLPGHGLGTIALARHLQKEDEGPSLCSSVVTVLALRRQGLKFDSGQGRISPLWAQS